MALHGLARGFKGAVDLAGDIGNLDFGSFASHLGDLFKSEADLEAEAEARFWEKYEPLIRDAQRKRAGAVRDAFAGKGDESQVSERTLRLFRQYGVTRITDLPAAAQGTLREDSAAIRAELEEGYRLISLPAQIDDDVSMPEGPWSSYIAVQGQSAYLPWTQPAPPAPDSGVLTKKAEVEQARRKLGAQLAQDRWVKKQVQGQQSLKRMPQQQVQFPTSMREAEQQERERAAAPEDPLMVQDRLDRQELAEQVRAEQALEEENRQTSLLDGPQSTADAMALFAPKVQGTQDPAKLLEDFYQRSQEAVEAQETHTSGAEALIRRKIRGSALPLRHRRRQVPSRRVTYASSLSPAPFLLH